MEVQQKGVRAERTPDDFAQSGKLTYGRLAGRRLPFLNKEPEEGLKLSALSGGRNGLYLEGSIPGIPSLMLVDTGANVTLIATDEKAEIHGKLNAAIECGSRKFKHRIYLAVIIDPCIFGLDFLQKFNFTVDLEKNEIRTGGEEIHLFSASAEHSKLCSVLVKEKTIIPARSECLIQAVPEVSGKFRYAVTDFPSQVSQKGVLGAATLVDLKREAIPVRVLNLDNKPKIVGKGAVIATCEPVVAIVARPQEFSELQHLSSMSQNLEGINEEQRTADEHLKNIRKVFQRLQKANLKLSPKKCRFLRKEVSYLGHVISAVGVKTYPEKIKAVVDWLKFPRTVHLLPSFCKKFLLNSKTPTKLILDTDASNEGIGAVFSQEIGNEECVIVYFSKILGKPERNYCVTRKELVAIMKSIEHFHHYL
ncbi:hypothetical protein AVEN_207631-1 [Araneus ventricosus]|uniref:Reverse transcriptase/retrotransposon-derived protein RNase H-like domain-containing protein n=1 Tax=Araneus ventricosus TaxID=182803 RepID=A0A4Y2L7I4_ARAVE|nr:hypothetical protein AVEN_207631-1 [Araneus ventricosus]